MTSKKSSLQLETALDFILGFGIYSMNGNQQKVDSASKMQGKIYDCVNKQDVRLTWLPQLLDLEKSVYLESDEVEDYTSSAKEIQI